MTRANSSLCPHCGSEHELSTQVALKDAMPACEALPRPGDTMFCIRCGEFCIVDGDGMLRRPRHSEARRLRRDPRCIALLAGWREVAGQRK